MNITEMTNYSSLPGLLFRQAPCISNLPFNTEIYDAWSRIGSGIGNEKTSINSALGEYFERRHFYMEIAPEERRKLHETLSEDEVNAFLLAFSQTSDEPIDILNHEFGTTTVTRVSDLSKCSIPTILISIGYQHGELDNHIYPARDTCGCSFHESAEESIFGAIKETLERQFLSRFWLTKKCNNKLTPPDINPALENSPTYPLYSALCKAGYITALDISDIRFPGACALVIYGTPDINRNVRFCAGMAFAKTFPLAIEKSIYELWQTYRFMDLYSSIEHDTKPIKDPYLKHFLSCNSFGTYKTLLDTTVQNHSINKSPIEFNTSSLISALSNLGIEGYLYTKMINLSENYFTFSRFVSPSLFLHMDNSKNINTKNEFSSDFLKDIHPDRQKDMVPFP